MKRIWLITVILLILVLMTSCRAKKNNDIVSGDPCEVDFKSSLYVDKEIIYQNDVIDVEKDKLKASLHVDNQGEELSLGFMLFSDGVPIQYMIDNTSYSYYVFTAEKKTKVDFTIMSRDLPQGNSNLSVVLLLNDMYMRHNRDDEKNYSMAMNYGINNSFDSFSEKPTIDQVNGTVITYDRLYKSCLNQSQPSMTAYTYEYEKKALYNMIDQQDIDICFSKPFDINESCNLSVLRNTVYNINSDEPQKTTIRIGGKAGEYYLTMFYDGEIYAAFNGRTTAKVVLEENAYTFIEIVLPPYAERSQVVVNGLMVECNKEYGASIYDSGLLNVYYAEREIDLSYNQSQSIMNLYYQNELITTNDEQIFSYTGDGVDARITFCEYSTSYNYHYSLMIFADGILQSFSVDNGDTYQHSYDIIEPYEITDLNVTFTPRLLRSCNNFDVHFIIVPKTISSSIAPPSKSDIDQCLTGTIHFVVSDQSEIQVIPEGEYINGDFKDSYNDFHVELKDNHAYNAYAANTILIEYNGLYDVDLTLSMETDDQDISCISTIMLNGSLLYMNNSEYFTWSTKDKKKDISVNISKEELAYGMNEIYVISYTGVNTHINRFIILIYKKTETPFAYSIEEREGLIKITTPETTNQGYSKVFCSAIGGDNSYFGNFYQCVTGRFLQVTQGQTSLMIGNSDYDDRMAVTTIITKIDYADGVYTFARVKSIGRIV